MTSILEFSKNSSVAQNSSKKVVKCERNVVTEDHMLAKVKIMHKRIENDEGCGGQNLERLPITVSLIANRNIIPTLSPSHNMYPYSTLLKLI